MATNIVTRPQQTKTVELRSAAEEISDRKTSIERRKIVIDAINQAERLALYCTVNKIGELDVTQGGSITFVPLRQEPK